MTWISTVMLRADECQTAAHTRDDQSDKWFRCDGQVKEKSRAPEPPAQSVNIQDVLHEHKGTVTQILQQRSVRLSPGPIGQPEVSDDPCFEIWRSVFDFRSLL